MRQDLKPSYNPKAWKYKANLNLNLFCKTEVICWTLEALEHYVNTVTIQAVHNRLSTEDIS